MFGRRSITAHDSSVLIPLYTLMADLRRWLFSDTRKQAPFCSAREALVDFLLSRKEVRPPALRNLPQTPQGYFGGFIQGEQLSIDTGEAAYQILRPSVRPPGMSGSQHMGEPLAVLVSPILLRDSLVAESSSSSHSSTLAETRQGAFSGAAV